MERVKELIERIRHSAGRIALGGGAVLLFIAVVFGIFAPALFFRAYLVAFVFFLGLGLGCLAILMLQHLANGAWGASMLRILEAGARTLPWLTLLGLPLYLGIPYLYVWTQPAVQASLGQKALYLNVPFFIARTIFYFAVWNGLVWIILRWSRERDETGDPRFNDLLRRGGAVGLVLFGLTVTFATVDWIMSIEPDWYSSIFAAMVAMGGVLAAFAFAVLVTSLFSRRPPLSAVASPQLFNDLGNLLLAFVMLWAYMSFSQYLLIWMGNLDQEITWYVHRLGGGWEVLAVVIGVLYFVLPFGLLIIREVKRHAWLLAPICAVLVATRWLEVYWLIVPSYQPTITLNALDVLVTFGIGGVWIASYARELRKQPLLSPTEPKLEQAEEWAQGAKPVTHGE